MNLAILSLVAVLAVPASPLGSQVRVEDALVVVEASSPDQPFVGLGVVIGDGSWVVCYGAMLWENSPEGHHRLQRLVHVTSPYLGRTEPGTVLEYDAELNLALVQVPWTGHPALAVAEPDRVVEADEVVLAAMPELFEGLEDGTVPIPEPNRLISQFRLPVDHVVLRKGLAQSMVVRAGSIHPCWGPLVSLDRPEILAVARGLEVRRMWLEGPCVHAFRSRILAHTAGTSLPAGPSLARAPDGLEVFRCGLVCDMQMRAHQYTAVLDTARRWMGMRPQQVQAYVLSARAANALHAFDQAEGFYRQAMDRAPEPMAQIQYMRFLRDRGRPKEARAILDALWVRRDLRPFLAQDAHDMLAAGQPDLCMQYLDQAQQADPNCARTWLALGMCKARLGQYGPAADAAARAVDLWPEDTRSRRVLSGFLHDAGRFKKMEEQYRILLERESDNPRTYIGLARFLSAHRADLAGTAKINPNEEALALAQKALTLPEREGLSHAQIRQITEKIKAGTLTCSQEPEQPTQGDR